MQKHSKHKSKARQQAPGPWSEWMWDSNHQRYYRYRLGADGQNEFELCDDPTTLGPSINSVEQLTAQFSTLSNTEAGYHAADAYPYSSETGFSTQPQATTTTDHAYGSSNTADRRSSHKGGKETEGKGKSKHRTEHHKDKHGKGKGRTQPSSVPEAGESSRAGSSYHQSSDAVSGGGYQQSAAYNNATWNQGMLRPEVAQQLEAADGHPYSQGYDSQQPGAYEPNYTTSSTSAAYTQYGYQGPASSAAESFDRAATPRAHAKGQPRLMAEVEHSAPQLDPRFRVEPSSRFQPGNIFKVSWPEPVGSAQGSTSASTKYEVTDVFGSRIFVMVRRFIIIATDTGHSTCVPISTYGGQACKKRGVKPDKHGIIYQRDPRSSRPRPLEGEPRLGFPPIKAELFEESERLAKESRVNYAKLTTIEHNCRVFFIGSVVASDRDLLNDAVNRCWELKTRHGGSRHS